ncbi:MAG: class I SAM-dependent methyltransferase [Xanthomonadales bacterium]|nr:class I SAM-dependent methyltransferase [Xanthomonadales bacterium]
MASTDPVLDALWYPFLQGSLRWPAAGPVVCVGARLGPVLRAGDWHGLICETEHRGDYEALEAAGLSVRRTSDEPAAAVLLLPPRQREHARACYARALQRLAPEGLLLVAQANADGARSCQADVTQLAGPLQVLSKHQCRVCWSVGPRQLDDELIAEWAAGDAPRRVEASGLLSRPGVFAWDRIDAASALLVSQLPGDLTGRVADLGAGHGYLSQAVLSRCAGVEAVDLFEVDARSLDLARANLAPFEPRVKLAFHWHDVRGGVPGLYDHIVCNPPFHASGGRERVDLGRAFLQAAGSALRRGGHLWLVANRHLPYEATLAQHFAELVTLTQSGGFKIIRATRR